MAYTDQLLSDTKKIKNYASGVLENISCLPSVLTNILNAPILAEFTAVALEGIKQNFINIADNISLQVQRTITKFTTKLNQVKEIAENITKAVCGVEALIKGIARDVKDLASSLSNGFKQSERCQYVGAQIGACIRAKIYNQLSGQLQRNIVNSDLYKDLAYGKVSALESINKKTDSLFRNINVPGISDSFLKAEAERVNRARIQLERVNNTVTFGSNTPIYGVNTYGAYNFRLQPTFDSNKRLIVKPLPSSAQ